MKTSMLCLLPSKIAPRGRGVDDLLTKGDQMRRAIFIVVTVVGIIGATPSPAAPTWQRTIVYDRNGNLAKIDMLPVDHRWVEGGICGIPGNANEPPGCRSIDYNAANFNQIFIDRFKVFTTRDLVYQKITVDAYLYYYSVIGWYPDGRKFPQTTNWAMPVGSAATFGFPAPDLVSYCPPIGGCAPAFWNLPRNSNYTIVVWVNWYDFYTGQLLATANYIPGTNLFPDILGSTNSDDMGCAYYAMGIYPWQSVVRCVPGITYAAGLPGTNLLKVGYLHFP